MNFFANLPFKRKLLWIIFSSVLFALVLAAAGFVTADTVQYRKAMPRDLNILAQIVADNARAPLAFSDPVFARETLLASLSAHPRITQAAIYDGTGAVFADYTRADVDKTPPGSAQPDGHTFAMGHLDVYHSIVDGSENAGTVFLQSDLQDFYNRLYTYSLVTVGVMLLATGGAFAMGFWLQRFVARPIESLADTAREVVARTDYSLRAVRYASDELGTLTDMFNGMLSHIESQAAELDESRVKMETLVNSINGIVWERDARDLYFTYVSRQSSKLLGFAPSVWTETSGFWQKWLHPEDATRAIATCRKLISLGQPYHLDYRMVNADGCEVWIRESGAISITGNGGRMVRGIFLDITEQKRAEEELAELNKKLAESHREAGMAEVATGVLHNVGNVLNTVNLSVKDIRERLSNSRVGHLRQAVSLLNAQNGHLAQFLQSDARGKALPGFLTKITDYLDEENQSLQGEAEKLVEHIDHIRDIVSTQQGYARMMSVIENASPSDLIDAAIKLTRDSLTKHGVEIVKSGADGLQVEVSVDRHKVTQILVNLLSNAKDAIKEARPSDRRVLIEASGVEEGEVAIAVTDFGVGIDPESMAHIFQLGFTTKSSGHGFGLHSSANAAREMNGSLEVKSEGPGKGATFTLKLPAGNPVPAS